jgi:hypothetical protein
MEAKLKVSAENVVSAAVASVLKRFIPGFSTKTFTLPFLIRRLIGSKGKVTTALNSRLSEFLKPTMWDSEYHWPREEREGLEEFLEEILFQNEAGEWVESNSLLIRNGKNIEAERAALAPPDRRLNEQYTVSNKSTFFLLCRGAMKVSDQELASWIEQALTKNEADRISAALRFLSSTSDELTSNTAGLLSAKTRDSLMRQSSVLSREDQSRVRGAFEIADRKIARDAGVEYSPINNLTPMELPITSDGISLEQVNECWDQSKAIEQFTISGIYRELVFPREKQNADLVSLLIDTNSIKGKEHWYRFLCLGCSLSIPLGINPSDRIIRFWKERLNAEFWAATIPNSLDEAKSSGYDQRLDAFFERIIHSTFRDMNASGEDAEFWRRVFYDFRKMHFFVFQNDLPKVLLELAVANDVAGYDIIGFLRSGNVPLSMRMPGEERWSGVIGQSMSAPLLFVMRELRRLEVITSDRFDSACYYMNSPATKIAYRLGWINELTRKDYSFSNLVGLSETVHEKIRNSEYAEGLLPHFDLPLQWYAYCNRR